MTHDTYMTHDMKEDRKLRKLRVEISGEMEDIDSHTAHGSQRRPAKTDRKCSSPEAYELLGHDRDPMWRESVGNP